MNITEFKYRYNSDKERALVLYRQGLLDLLLSVHFSVNFSIINTETYSWKDSN